MPGDFTSEQWREIDDARARLEAYKAKIQPYPALPAEQIIPRMEKVSNPKMLEQLRNEVQGWRQKHAEMMNEFDKLKRKGKRETEPF